MIAPGTAKAAPVSATGASGEIGDQAADLPQEVLAGQGGRPHPPRRRIIAPGETPMGPLGQPNGTPVQCTRRWSPYSLGSVEGPRSTNAPARQRLSVIAGPVPRPPDAGAETGLSHSGIASAAARVPESPPQADFDCPWQPRIRRQAPLRQAPQGQPAPAAHPGPVRLVRRPPRRLPQSPQGSASACPARDHSRNSSDAASLSL